MPRLILLLAVLTAVYILFRRVQAMPPHKRRGEYIKLALGVTVVLVIIGVLTGRMHWVGAALTGLLVFIRQMLPVLIRMFPALASSLHASGALGGQKSGSQQSTVETALLRMQLDHDTGNLEGEVLKGDFVGWRLADMDRDQLEQLQAWCQREDADSLALLESYLEQRFPDEPDFGQQRTPPSSGNMARKEALAVLGLDEDAKEEDIIGAHRKLMQKMHPDRGGSDYLAAKINQAKDYLLGV